MGAGKSRVGQRLAASVGAPFVDTDLRIVERYGPIDEIFDREGEEYFRIVEREVVADALREEAVDLARRGSGAARRHARRPRRPRPWCGCSVSPEAVAPRLTGGTRPLLADGGIAALDARSSRRARRSTREVADVDIDTSRRSVARIVDEITERFRGGAR